MSNNQDDKPIEPSQTPGIRQQLVNSKGIKNVRPNAIEINDDGQTGSLVKKVEPLPISNGEKRVE